MKKVLLSVFLSAVCIFSAGQAMAALSNISVSIYAEHRAYDSAYYSEADRYYLNVYWEAAGLDDVTVNSFIVSYNGESYNLTEETSIGIWAPTVGTIAFAAKLGYTNNPDLFNADAWEGTYSFALDTSGDDYSSTYTVSYDLTVMDAPTVSVSGNTVTWGTVDGADQYRIRLIDINDPNNLLYQFKVNSDGSDSYSFDLSGLVLSGNYILRVETRDYESGSLAARSSYTTQISIVPVPGAFLLFGSGLLIVTGYRRRHS